MLFHVAYEFTLDQNLRQIGFVGVSLFFISSGFILSKNYPNLLGFDLAWMKKRYVHIASLYYPTLVVIALLFGTQVYSGDLSTLLLHFTFLNWVSPTSAYAIIRPAWFIIPLVAFYLLFPYLNRFICKYPAFLGLVVLIALADRFFSGGFTSFSPIFFLADFCFGIALGADRKDLWFITLLVLAMIHPCMVVSYIIFWGLSYTKLDVAASPVSFISKRTFEIFLFHESVMKVLVGKWSVFGLGISESFVVLASLCF